MIAIGLTVVGFVAEEIFKFGVGDCGGRVIFSFVGC